MENQTQTQINSENNSENQDIDLVKDVLPIIIREAVKTLNNPIKEADEGGNPFVIIKTTNNDGKTIDEHVQSIEELLPNPIRKTANTRFTRPESFTQYVQFHKVTGQTSIYIDDTDSLRVTAIINDHQIGSNGVANWGDHQATYRPEFSREWLTWKNANGTKARQAEFAQFIEKNLLDIAQPAGADLLEIVKTLEAKKSVKYKSGVRLDNGDTLFQYEETTDSKAGEKGQFAIPQTVTLAIPVFKGGDPYQLDANFRYRIEDGNLSMWLELVRPHKILEHAMESIVQKFIEGIADVPFYYGFK